MVTTCSSQFSHLPNCASKIEKEKKMLNSSIHYRSNQASFAYQKSFIHRNVEPVLVHLHQGLKPNPSHIGFTNNLSVVKESSFAMTSINRPISIKVVVTIKQCINDLFPHFGFKPRLDHITNWWPSQALGLEFISNEMDPSMLIYLALYINVFIFKT